MEGNPMPRESAASAAFPRTDTASSRPQPPPDLSPEAREIFEALVRTAPKNHFRASDAAVLEVYAAAVATARRAERELRDGPITAGGRASPWVKIRNDSTKTIASLAMRLRLCPQARMTARTNGRQRDYVGPPPWE
jgi:phage terminase small subunit